MRLTATATLNQFGSFFHQITCFQSAGNQVVTDHNSQHWFIGIYCSGYKEEIFCNFTTKLESDVLHYFGGHRQAELNDFNAVNLLYIFQQAFFDGSFFFFHEVFHLFFQSCVFVDILANGHTKVGSIVEKSFQVAQSILDRIQHFFYASSGICFDTAYTGSYRTLRDNFYHTDISGSGNVGTSTEFNG